jgi:hypothetical protein
MFAVAEADVQRRAARCPKRSVAQCDWNVCTSVCTNSHTNLQSVSRSPIMQPVGVDARNARSVQVKSLPTITGPARFGTATRTGYAKTFFEAYPELHKAVVVHHAVPQKVLDEYRGLVSWQEMHSLENLRGIPISLNPDVHLSKIRKRWEQFYKAHANVPPTKQQLLDFATKIDKEFGHLFVPVVQ